MKELWRRTLVALLVLLASTTSVLADETCASPVLCDEDCGPPRRYDHCRIEIRTEMIWIWKGVPADIQWRTRVFPRLFVSRMSVPIEHQPEFALVSGHMIRLADDLDDDRHLATDPPWFAEIVRPNNFEAIGQVLDVRFVGIICDEFQGSVLPIF